MLDIPRPEMGPAYFKRRWVGDGRKNRMNERLKIQKVVDRHIHPKRFCLNIYPTPSLSPE